MNGEPHIDYVPAPDPNVRYGYIRKKMMETTCSSCRHWHKQEPPKPVGIQLLKKDKPPLVGDCREQLRLVVLPNGSLMSCYAQTQEQMPACSRHEERI